MDAKAAAVEKAIAEIVRQLTEQRGANFGPILESVFDAGSIEYATALQRAMGSMANPTFGPSAINTPPTTLGTPGRDGRAPRGAVRKALVALLKSRAPAAVLTVEAVNDLPLFDPNVAGNSARNELNRNRDRLYRLDSDGWRLIDGANLDADDETDADSEIWKDRVTEP